MLEGTSAVLNQREREGGFSLEVLAALTADHDPAARLRCRRVVLQQHGLADTAQAGQSDVARKDGESGDVLVKARELGCPVRQVGWVQSHSGPEWVDARG